MRKLDNILFRHMLLMIYLTDRCELYKHTEERREIGIKQLADYIARCPSNGTDITAMRGLVK